MKKTLKYSIGDYIVISGYMDRIDRNDGIKWLPFLYPTTYSFVLYQVIGQCIRYDGRVEGGFHREDPCCFIPGKAHIFWEIRKGLRNKPIVVSEKQMRLATIEEVEDLPVLASRRYLKSDRTRQYLSEDSKRWPRNEMGRWEKTPPI